MLHQGQNNLVNRARITEERLHPVFIWVVVVPTCLAFSPIIILSLAIAYPTRWWEKSSRCLEQQFTQEVRRRKL